jgi:hypothetical protein
MLLMPQVPMHLRGDVVRAVAEHSASFLNDPPRGTVNLDVSGLAAIDHTPGESRFEFANSHHHEVQLAGVDGLRDLIRGALVELDERRCSVSRDELLDYAAARLADLDPEWQTALADRPKWLGLIGKRGSSSTAK